VIAAWTRSKSVFSSTNNTESRVPFSLFNSAAFCSFKPFSSSSSSASLRPEALLDAILPTGRHGSKRQTSATSSHLLIFVPQSRAVGKVDQGLSKVGNITTGQSGAVDVSETGRSVSTVLYMHECTGKVSGVWGEWGMTPSGVWGERGTIARSGI